MQKSISKKLNKCLVLFSGGMDSTTLLYWALKKYNKVYAIGFDYRQRHKIELKYAKKIAKLNNVSFKILKVDLKQIGGSLLTGKSGSVVVPGRNMIFLSLAVGYAMTKDIKEVFFCPTRDDYKLFRDCRPDFVEKISLASFTGYGVKIKAPFVNLNKKEIVKIGKKLNVPYEMTWSCYFPVKGKPCNKCLACKKRYEALTFYQIIK
uniref:7-cyano-7-deazaguanine synthase n=1 Tax=Dictyoglomus turgidum TaxID=513050 RepID=A0A7C3WME5_9BACT